MVFVSCKLYGIATQKLPEAIKLLGARGSQVYDEKHDHKLNFIVRPVGHLNESEYGILSDVYFDDIFFVRTIDPGTLAVTSKPAPQTTGPVTTIIYTKRPLDSVLGIFAPKATAQTIRNIVNGLIRDKSSPISNNVTTVRFLLNQKEKEIREIPGFSNVNEISVDNIDDLYIDSIWMKGSDLNKAPEYSKAISDEVGGGRIKFLALSYKERNYYFIEDGRVFTRQGTNPHEDFATIYELVTKLDEVKAVRFL